MIPKTSYLLNAIKEVYIHQSDPSKMNSDPIEGLKERENFLKKLTHEMLDATLEDYEGLEASAAKVGSNLIPFVLGLKQPEYMIPPTIDFSDIQTYDGSSSSSSAVEAINIYVGKTYFLETTIHGGNVSIYSYSDYQWIVSAKPTGGNVTIQELFNQKNDTEERIGTLLDFILPGSYSLQIKLEYTLVPSITILKNLTVLVEEAP